MTPSCRRRSEKKAEEEMLATMDKPEWTVASTGGKKGGLHFQTFVFVEGVLVLAHGNITFCR
jgi:hypothetical protein